MTLLHPVNWAAPSHIKAYTTTRAGGVSQAPYDNLNLAVHVGDDLINVVKNRALLRSNLPSEPIWLTQIHGNNVVELIDPIAQPTADASFTQVPQRICTVLTGDCLPILLCNRMGTCVAAIHGGWRSLSTNILEQTLARFPSDSRDILAWLGPCIGSSVYEVGMDVRDAFSNDCFTKLPAAGKFLCDLHGIARAQLAEFGVVNVSADTRCTFTNKSNFFSHRRDGQTGRMATLIWIDKFRSMT